MKNQTIKTANERLNAARERILDYFGHVHDLREVVDHPIHGRAIDRMGIEAFSEAGLVKIDTMLKRAHRKALREMPEDERRTRALALGLAVL